MPKQNSALEQQLADAITAFKSSNPLQSRFLRSEAGGASAEWARLKNNGTTKAREDFKKAWAKSELAAITKSKTETYADSSKKTDHSECYTRGQLQNVCGLSAEEADNHVQFCLQHVKEKPHLIEQSEDSCELRYYWAKSKTEKETGKKREIQAEFREDAAAASSGPSSGPSSSTAVVDSSQQKKKARTTTTTAESDQQTGTALDAKDGKDGKDGKTGKDGKDGKNKNQIHRKGSCTDLGAVTTVKDVLQVATKLKGSWNSTAGKLSGLIQSIATNPRLKSFSTGSEMEVLKALESEKTTYLKADHVWSSVMVHTALNAKTLQGEQSDADFIKTMTSSLGEVQAFLSKAGGETHRISNSCQALLSSAAAEKK